jgi:hypothetical protein
MAKAAQLLIENPTYTAKVALLMAGYDNSTATSERAKKTLSKNKNRLIEAVRKSDQRNRIANYRASVRNTTITVTTATTESGNTEISPLTEPSSSTTTTTSSTTQEASGSSKQSNTNTGRVRSATAAKPDNRKLRNRSKVIASNSRRTPNQLNKFFIEKNKIDGQREAAYQEAIHNASVLFIPYAKAARDASQKYNIEVKADTVRKCVIKGEKTVKRPGPKGKISEEEYDAVCSGFITYLAIAQMNGDPEKKINRDIVPKLEELFHGTAKSNIDARTLWRRIQRDCSEELQFSSEFLQELRRQFWTTYENLDRWFDAWEAILVELGFASRDAEGRIEIPEDQRRRICNCDETKLSVDGCDGGVGGRPANSVSVRIRLKIAREIVKRCQEGGIETQEV